MNTPNRLAELRARKAEREETAKAAAEALEVQALELAEKYVTDGLKEDVDFVVVTTAVGNFVVSKPEFIVGKRFADAEKKDAETIVQFIAPCIKYPEQMVARQIFTEHGGIPWKLTLAALKLYEADASKHMGK